ncbi:MAG: flagellar biosynthesis protein FlhB [Gammaproteobacteria bacterium]|nr:flagellar biosynthesis protein FlhB [Gammaproteobacteria bacterium]
MAESEKGQERSEEATEKRKKESRDKGEVVRSKELTTLVMMLVSGAGFVFLGSALVQDLMQILRAHLSIERAQIFDLASYPGFLFDTLQFSIFSVMPLFILLVVVAIVAPMALGGWTFSVKPLKPELKKMDPIKGLGRVFSLKGLMELVKALAKFLLVSAVAYFLLKNNIEGFVSLGNESLVQGISRMGEELMWMFILLSSVLFFVVLVDTPFQMWDHNRKQKMTLQEVKDERKETDGNPEVKSKIRQTQQEISQRRMMEEVPKADVVITNPTHFSVALRYDQSNMGAPIVVALGADEIAGHIRRIAVANDVPLLSAPPLARSLYYHCELNEEIPAGLFLAVAQVLAYVYQLRQYEFNGGVAPEFDTDVPIPDDLKRDSEL